MMPLNEWQTELELSQKRPKYFVEEILNSRLWEKQEQIINSVRDNKYTVVRSGHGVGKTFIAANTALWFLYSFQPSKVITTAPTWNQVRMILWQEINKLFNKARTPLGGILNQTQINLGDEHFAVGLSTDQPDRFQGHHSENILVIFDEGPGVKSDIWEASQGLLTSPHSRFLAIGNPTTPHGDFYNAFKDPLYNKISISCLDCPNVTTGELLYPGLVTKEWIEERKQEWGEQSPVYKSRVLGEFPVEGEDTLIPLTWVERAITKTIEVNNKIVLGIDVARYGSDSTVFTILNGNKVVHQEGYVGKATTKTIGKAIQLATEYKCQAIAIDDSGVGGGVTDSLQEQLNNTNIKVVPVNFGSVAKDVGRFENLKAEIYWNLRCEFEQNLIEIGDRDKLLEQLPSILYEITSKGKIKIVSKDKMKEMGINSPDYADSLVIAHYATYCNQNNLIDYLKTYENQSSFSLIQSLNEANFQSTLQPII
jgi:hypothetical protein